MKEERIRRIACVGDSITFGHCASDASQSYPAALGRLLGAGWETLNFGRNSATLLSDYTYAGHEIPYTMCEPYAPSLASEPDIVLIMLGMNDANPLHALSAGNDGALSDALLERYFAEACALIQTYRALPAHPAVFFCQTTWMLRQTCAKWDAHYIARFLGNLEKLLPVQRRVAQAEGVPYIDTREGMRLPEYYFDGAHMTDMGYAALAAVIARQLRENNAI